MAGQLYDTGDFEVRRNPIPVFAHCMWDYDNARPYPTRFYLGLLNNVLLQVEGASKQVWLPSLSQAPYLDGQTEYLTFIECANIALWVQLGYEVRLINADFHLFWHWMGGLRCMTKDLMRRKRPKDLNNEGLGEKIPNRLLVSYRGNRNNRTNRNNRITPKRQISACPDARSPPLSSLLSRCGRR